MAVIPECGHFVSVGSSHRPEERSTCYHVIGCTGESRWRGGRHFRYFSIISWRIIPWRTGYNVRGRSAVDVRDVVSFSDVRRSVLQSRFWTMNLAHSLYAT